MEEARSLMAWKSGADMPEDIETDPLFVGLVLRLPKLGSQWAKADREAWLAMFNAIADGVHPESKETPAAPPLKLVREPEVLPAVAPARATVTETRTVKTTREAAITTHRIADDEEGDVEALDKHSSTRAEIIRVLRDHPSTLDASAIWENGKFECEIVNIYNELSHMTLRKGWLRREKVNGVYSYQVNEQAKLPEYLAASQ